MNRLKPFLPYLDAAFVILLLALGQGVIALV